MSTQKNLSKSDPQQPLLTALLALSALLLAGQSNWIWNSLYFQLHSVGELVIALVLMLVWFNACVGTLRLTLGRAVSYKVTNAGILLLFSLILFKYLKQIELIPANTTPLNKIALVLTSGLAASLLALKISPSIWKRLHLALIAGAMVFALLPILLANTLAPTVYWPSPSEQSTAQEAPKLPMQNTIILLLDEFSASAAQPVVDQLKSAGLHVTSTSIDPAGKDTIDVIPAIWTRSNFDLSAPCGPTQLCSASGVLDFSKVHASSENIDIVGFFHRYCSIQGLRSCNFSPLPKQSAIIELTCSFPGVNELIFLGCGSNTSIRTSFTSLRKNMLNTTLEAPFWKNGGVLFAHLLVPHPLMGIPLKPLHDEYEDNIKNSVATVKLVTEKAKSIFRNNFRIIVFSDHPLRGEMWCTDGGYKEIGCNLVSSQISSQVPLIIASPSNEDQLHKNIKNNQDIFDILYK